MPGPARPQPQRPGSLPPPAGQPGDGDPDEVAADDRGGPEPGEPAAAVQPGVQAAPGHDADVAVLPVVEGQLLVWRPPGGGAGDSNRSAECLRGRPRRGGSGAGSRYITRSLRTRTRICTSSRCSRRSQVSGASSYPASCTYSGMPVSPSARSRAECPMIICAALAVASSRTPTRVMSCGAVHEPGANDSWASHWNAQPATTASPSRPSRRAAPPVPAPARGPRRRP